MKGKKNSISSDLPDYFTNSAYGVFYPKARRTSCSKRITEISKNDVSSESPHEFHVPEAKVRVPNPLVPMSKLPSRRGSDVPLRPFIDETNSKTALDLHQVVPSMSIEMSSIKRAPVKSRIDFYKKFDSHLKTQGFGKNKGLYSFRADQPHFGRVDSDSVLVLRATMYNTFHKRKYADLLVQSSENYKVNEGLIGLADKIVQLREKQGKCFTKSFKRMTERQRSGSMESLFFTTQSPIKSRRN